MAVNPFPKSVLQVLQYVPVGGQIPAGYGGTGNTTFGIGSNLYYVNSAAKYASDGTSTGGPNGRNPEQPFKTLNFALTQTVNNNGDIIVCLPGHVESVIAAAGLTFPTTTAAGVTVIFLGNEVDRATINFGTATTATMTIPAANVTLITPMFTNSLDAMAAPISITGADCKIIKGEYRDGPVFNTLIQLITTTAAKRLQVLGWRYYEDKTGGGTQKTEGFRVVGGDHHRFEDVHITGDFTTGCWNNVTTLTTELIFNGCTFNNLNTTPHVAIAILTTSTGVALATILVIASGSTWLTASNKITFDGASSAAVPGGVFAHPNG